MSGYTLIVLGLASARLWFLIGRDELTAPVRDRLPDGLAYWVTCPWCSGSWTAFAVVLAWWLGLPVILFEALAVAMIVALLALAASKLAD